MVTSMCSRHRLGVRFSPPAPILVIFVMFLLCCSAGAVSFSDGVLYSFTDFQAYGVYESSIAPGNIITSYPKNVTGASYRWYFFVNPSYSGRVGTNQSLSQFDIIDTQYRFLKLSVTVPRLNNSILSSKLVEVYGSYNNGTLINNNMIQFSTVLDSFLAPAPTYSYNNNGLFNLYAFDYEVLQDKYIFNYYVSLRFNATLNGFSVEVSRPTNTSRWDPSPEGVTFILSNTKLLPPSSGSSGGGSGGSVDLSSITSQINSLSSQMSASFNQVNANIDAAETSIASSISDQTTALEGAISDAADTVTDGINGHFDSWDSQLSGSFSPSDAQIVVDTNAAVSGVHQFEEDQVDDTEAALADVGLDGYTIPSEISGTFSEVGTILTLLFNSFGFVTPLIIFSCTFGIAFVLIGRKSRGSE